MKKKALRAALSFVMLFCLLSVSFAPLAYAQEADVNVLFVGNSLTYKNSMPEIFEGIAKTAGLSVNADMCAYGSARLSYYADSENAKGEEMREMMYLNDYDYVVIQPHSTELITSYETSTLPSASTIVDLVRAYGAEPILYMTWGLKEGYTYEQDGYEYNLDCEEMTKELIRKYYLLANELGVKVAPCGENFWRFRQEYPDKELYNEDNKHPVYFGSYLAACTIFNTVFSGEKSIEGTCLGIPYWYTPGENEDDDPIINIKIDSETARQMQEIADVRMSTYIKTITMPVLTIQEFSADISANAHNNFYNTNFALGDEIRYYSTDNSVISVDLSSGKITAVGGGTALVEVKSDSGVTICTTVNVRKPAAYATISKEELTLDIGDKAKLTAKAYPKDATDRSITWSSSNTDVATVSSDGEVKAIAAGRAKIYARTHNGHAAVCTVDVKLSKPKGLSVTMQTSNKGTRYANHKLTWNSVKDATQYLVYRSTSKDGIYKLVETVTDTAYIDKNVERGTRYYYKVYASIGKLANRSDASSKVNIKVPLKVTNCSAAKKKGDKKATVSWAKQGDVGGYQVFRATKKNGKYTRIKTVKKSSVSSYTDKNVKKKKTYYYKVRAFTTVGGKRVYGTFSSKAKTK